LSFLNFNQIPEQTAFFVAVV